MAVDIHTAESHAVPDSTTVLPRGEDDALNVICLGGLAVGQALAGELVRTVLEVRFSGAESHRHRRRLAIVAGLERRESPP